METKEEDDGKDEKGGKEKSVNFIASAALETASLICSMALSVSIPISKSSQSPVNCQMWKGCRKSKKKRKRDKEIRYTLIHTRTHKYRYTHTNTDRYTHTNTDRYTHTRTQIDIYTHTHIDI